MCVCVCAAAKGKEGKNGFSPDLSEEPKGERVV